MEHGKIIVRFGKEMLPPRYGQSPMTRSSAVSLLLVITMACSYHDGPFRQIAGKPLDQSKVAQIVDGTTSEKQVIEWFGEPVDTRQLDGQRCEFVY
jgi:hypothetical protein